MENLPNILRETFSDMTLEAIRDEIERDSGVRYTRQAVNLWLSGKTQPKQSHLERIARAADPGTRVYRFACRALKAQLPMDILDNCD